MNSQPKILKCVLVAVYSLPLVLFATSAMAFGFQPVPTVPEPGTLSLIVAAAAAVAVGSRFWRKK